MTHGVLVVNTNLPRILYCVRDIAFDRSKIATPLVLNSPDGGFRWTISAKFSVDVKDGQGTKWRRNIPENFNRRSRVHERCKRQTDRPQTDGPQHIANVNVSAKNRQIAKSQQLFDQSPQNLARRRILARPGGRPLGCATHF